MYSYHFHYQDMATGGAPVDFSTTPGGLDAAVNRVKEAVAADRARSVSIHRVDPDTGVRHNVTGQLIPGPTWPRPRPSSRRP